MRFLFCLLWGVPCFCCGQLFLQPDGLFHVPDGREALEVHHNYQVAAQFSAKTSQFLLAREAHMCSLYKTPVEENDVFFYTIVKILNREKMGERMALSFLRGPHSYAAKAKMNFYLGLYYFYDKKYDKASKLFSKVELEFLDNDQILVLKFYQAYAFFVARDFTSAFVLFDVVRQIQTGNPLYSDAVYYFGFLQLYLKHNRPQALAEFRRIDQDSFYQNVVPYYIGYLACAVGERDEAVAYIDKALKRSRVLYRSSLLRLSAHLRFDRREYQRCIDLLNMYRKEDGAQLRRGEQYHLGFSYYQLGQMDSAIVYLRKASVGTTDSVFYNAMYNLANIYLQTGDKHNARACLVYCLDDTAHNETHKSVIFTYAKLSLELGHADVAAQTIHKYMKRYPNATDIGEAKDILTMAYVYASNYKEAVKYVESASSAQVKHLKTKIYYARAVELVHDNWPDSALYLFRKISESPYRDRYYYYSFFWSSELLISQKKYKEAVRELEKCLPMPAKYNSDEVGVRKIKYNLANAYFLLYNYRKALGVFTSIAPKINVAPREPMDEDILIKMADCFFLLRMYPRATDYYSATIGYNTSYADYATFQLALLRGIDNVGAKIDGLGLMLQKFPRSPYVYRARFELARAYFLQNDYDGAQRWFLAILADKSDNQYHSTALLNLGLIALNTKRYGDAVAHFKRLHEQFPHSADAEGSLDFLKESYLALDRVQEYVQFVNTHGYQISSHLQDSLFYETIQVRKRENRNKEVEKLSVQYLQNYPYGYYRDKIFYTLAKTYKQRADKDKKYIDKTLSMCDSLLVPGRSHPYREEAARIASELTFEQLADDKRALPYLLLLKDSSGVQNKKLAFQALLIICHRSGDFHAGYGLVQNAYEQKVQFNGVARPYVRYFTARHLLDSAQYQAAIDTFRLVVQENHGQLAAEADYFIAYAYFLQHQWDKAEKSAFVTIKKHSSYEYWVANSYVLLGDIYARKSDAFNAKATYKSVMQNTSIPELAQRAQRGYDSIIRSERAAQQRLDSMRDANALPSALEYK